MKTIATGTRKMLNSRRRPLALRLLVALILGTLAGLILGTKAFFLGELGILIIKLLKALATPLIFFAIVDSFQKVEIPARKGLKLVAFSTLNAAVALTIALSISKFFPIARYVNLEAVRSAAGDKLLPQAAPLKLDFSAALQSFIPKSVVEPFTSNDVIGVVFLAIVFGIALRKVSSAHKPNERQLGAELLVNLIAAGLSITSLCLSWIVFLIPYAVFGVIAKVVGATGFDVFLALAAFVGLVATGLFLQVFVYYALWIVTRKAPLQFFKRGFEALLTAFSTGSSLATLPVTLKTLDEKMKVGLDSSRLAACVGTNLNHDGILLYEAVAALFIAQVHGLSLSATQQITLALSSVVAAVGIAGVPDAGLITLSLVFGAIGLPLTYVPLLLPVDWFLGRLRATTNVASDMTVANLLDAR